MTYPASVGALTLAFALTTTTAPAIGVWSVDSMTRVFRDQPARPAVDPHLSAARGESESFQVVLTGSPAELTGARVFASELIGSEGSRLPAPEVLREHYVTVSVSSPQSGLPPGDYPDALVPQHLPASPLPNLTVLNQPFWVDVHVPYGTPAGPYHGHLRIDLPHGSSQSLHYTLEVWPFDLPVVPSMKSSFWLGWRRVAEVHGFDPQADDPTPELADLLESYQTLLARHRLSIDQARLTYPDARTGRLTNEPQIEQALRRQLLHRHASALSLPLFEDWPFFNPLGRERKAAMRYLADWMKIANQAHGADRIYLALGALDEPNTAEDYDHVRQWGAFINEAEATHGFHLPLMITEQPTPDDPAWGSLVGAVDIWVPHFASVYDDLEHPAGAKAITQRLAAGEEVWTYGALVQLSEHWKQQHGHPKTVLEGHPPVWLTDYPPINHRIVPWMMHLHGLTGIAYWDLLHFPANVDPWHNAGTFIGFDNGSTYNGDGFYIYPATQRHHGIDLPIASIRLKWIRDSVDDFDYLTLARHAGLSDAARTATQTFCRGFGDWKNDVPALLAARDQIARQLSGLPTDTASAPPLHTPPPSSEPSFLPFVE